MFPEHAGRLTFVLNTQENPRLCLLAPELGYPQRSHHLFVLLFYRQNRNCIGLGCVVFHRCHKTEVSGNEHLCALLCKCGRRGLLGHMYVQGGWHHKLSIGTDKCPHMHGGLLRMLHICLCALATIGHTLEIQPMFVPGWL